MSERQNLPPRSELNNFLNRFHHYLDTKEPALFLKTLAEELEATANPGVPFDSFFHDLGKSIVGRAQLQGMKVTEEAKEGLIVEPLKDLENLGHEIEALANVVSTKRQAVDELQTLKHKYDRSTSSFDAFKTQL